MKRRKAREYALQILFQIDFTKKKFDSFDFEQFWSEKRNNQEIKQFTEELVRGTVDNLEEIDTMLDTVADNWILGRMAAVDRAILRFAAYELLYRKDIPSAVTINEAIEIAKKYSSSEAVSFLNGVLDRFAHEVKKGQ
jgi:N utilization substance protein B